MQRERAVEQLRLLPFLMYKSKTLSILSRVFFCFHNLWNSIILRGNTPMPKKIAKPFFSETQTHLFLGTCLFFTALFLCLSFVLYFSRAASVTSRVTITGSAPHVVEVHVNTVDSSSLSDATVITPTPGTTKTVYVNGLITDAAGVPNISVMNATFARSGVTCALSGVNDDNNDCYHQAACTVGTENFVHQIPFSCSFAVAYYADATSGGTYSAGNWIATAHVQNLEALSDSASTTTEMNQLVAIDVPTTLDFGSLAPGESTTVDNNQAMLITQNGNVAVDVNVSGTAMSCSILGSIPQNDISYNLSDLSTGTAVTGSLVTLTDFNLLTRTSDSTPMTKNLYWNLTVPLGASGSCTGSVTVTAVMH